MSRSAEVARRAGSLSRSLRQYGSVGQGYAARFQGSVAAPGPARSVDAASAGALTWTPVAQLPALNFDELIRHTGQALSQVVEPGERARAAAALEESCASRVNVAVQTAEAAVQRRHEAEERSRDAQRQQQIDLAVQRAVAEVQQRHEAQQRSQDTERQQQINLAVQRAVAEAQRQHDAALRAREEEMQQRIDAAQQARAAWESQATESIQREAELNRQLLALKEASQRQEADAEVRLAAAAASKATETTALADTRRLLQEQAAASRAESDRNNESVALLNKQLAEARTELSGCEAKVSSATEETKRLSAQLAARAAELATVRSTLEQKAATEDLRLQGDINKLKHIVRGARLSMIPVWSGLGEEDKEETKKNIQSELSGEQLSDSLAWIALMESTDPAVWDFLNP